MRTKIVLMALFILLISCSGPVGNIVQNDDISLNLTLEYTVIDGMPCLYNDTYRQGALSCDWSKWNGRIEDGEIVIGN